MSKKIITLCSSASFYAECLDIAEKLTDMGFEVKVPSTAFKMKARGDFNPETYKTWFKNSSDYHRKTKLMEEHFQKVLEADAILMVNGEKNGVAGYIGGNGLMEMTVAYLNKKPIFVLREVSDKSIIKEEILGLHPIFVNENLSILKETIS